MAPLISKHDVLAWQHIDSRPLFKHPRVELIEETVIPPSGQPTIWWRFTKKCDAVCLICIDQQQRILVTYQYNPPPRQVVDEFPGGGIEKEEALKDAARRELLEETGLYAHTLRQLGSFFMNHRRSSMRCYAFLATNLEQRAASPEITEIIGHEWVPLEEFEERIRRGEIENMVSLACWSLFLTNRSANPAEENS